ncbi:MAG: BMP family ABC transporter substrate-binding protein [Anaerolineales bacterium]|nr:BMP family ABC transporter substrate-binding protein [Anaerolineales bacterium]
MSTDIPAATLKKFTTFGDLLRFLRRRVGITQMELAAAVGYSDAQISRLEQNLRLPDIPTIKTRFAHALGVEDEPKTIARLLDLAANVRREDAPGLGLCPYKGLNYFDEADADLFVGREELTSKLTERLLSLTQAGVNNPSRFLAVVGASGSGKSSLVRAGLVPALRWNQVSSGWDIRILTPTAHPLASVAESLGQDSFADEMLNSNQSLSRFVQKESHLLLVIDQFEETFALCRSEEERTAFINNLLTAATDPNGKVAVVITLRADFYAHCANYVQLREALATQQEYIGAMNEDEMRRAIEEPARRGRWEFEPGLVDLLLRDVGREPGALPLLSHALMETWQRRRARMMTLSGYASSGGVRGAIAETAESVFVDQFTPEQRAIARRIFLRLTELSDESTAGDTRRRASFNELILKPDEAVVTQTVLQALADARLIITSEDSAEVAHEALIREWPTLRSWLEENRDGLRLHRHLTDSAQEWQTLNRESDILYRGARLAQAMEWASSHQDEMNDLEREFLEESRAHAEREAVEKEARRQRELEAAQKLAEVEGKRAEEQAQAASQLRRRAFYLRLAFLAAVLLATAAGFFGLRSQQTSQIAASRELAAASVSNLESDPERSILLALEAIKRSNTLEAENALHQAVMTSRVKLVFNAFEPGSPVHVAFSSDDRYIAAASMDGTISVWSVRRGRLRFLFNLPGIYVHFSPDGKNILIVQADGKVRAWNIFSENEIQVSGQIEAISSVDVSPDGRRLVTVTNGNLPRVWDLKTGRELMIFPGHSDYVSFAYFSPDGSHILTSSDDGTARIWNASTGKELLALQHDDWVWNAAFSPDGQRVVTSSGAQVFIWDAATGEKLFTLNGHVSTVHVAAFSPDGAMLATGSYDRKIIVWNANTGEPLFTLAGHAGSVFSLEFSPDGKQLVSSSDDGTLRIWDATLEHGEALNIPYMDGIGEDISLLPNGQVIAAIEGNKLKLWSIDSGNELRDFSGAEDVTAFDISPDGSLIAAARDDFSVTLYNPASTTGLRTWTAHTGLINALAFSPGGKWLATASDDYKVIIWDLSEGKPVNILTLTMPDSVNAIAFNSDGTQLAIGLGNGTVRIRDFESGEDLHILRGHDDVILSLAFSPDDSLLATASLDGTAKIWDVQTGAERFALEGHTNSVTALAFTPDGKRLATSSRDGTAKIWDVSTGQELLNFPGNGSGINSLAFNPAGTLLVTSGDREARVYILQVDELAKLAQDRVTRRLTQEECLKYLHEVTDDCAPEVVVPTITPLPATANGRICQVTNMGGLNDNYFNELLYAGVEGAAQIHAWEASVLQSASTADFMRNLDIFTDADCRLIVAPGNLAEAMQTVAQADLIQRFMLMDYGFDPPLENVWIQTYAVDQAAFLAGYVAASTTKTGKVGTFGGIDIPLVTAFMDGFALGVEYYNRENGTNVQVLGWDAEKHEGLFTGSFCCSTEGRQAARQLLDAGADVILPVAGQSVGVGAGTEILEYGNAYVIGVDTDWMQTNPEFKDIILTSIEKRFDVSVMLASDAIANDSFTGGYHLGTLETGEVDLSPIRGLTPEMQLALERITADIISGKIKTMP